VHIRKANPDTDFDTMVDIGHKFFEFNAYRHYTTLDEVSLLDTFTHLYLDGVLLVVEHEGKVVGMAGAFIAPLYWNHAYLQGLEAFWWIDSEHRGSGAGSELRKALQTAAKQKGAHFWNMIALKESMHDQVCAQYERSGMTPVETVYMKVL
jgi:L-amino acid N-acyltransferase YncA